MKGKFITIEGIDGSGKSTMSKYIVEQIKKRGHNVILTREPGGIDVSEEIRNIILTNDIDPRTEALLFAASRREHIKKKIEPALEEGTFVVCDRFLDSSIAYQVFGRNLKMEDIISINDFALDGLEVDVTFYFDVDVEEGLSRTRGRNENNKLDSESEEFYKRIKSAYDYLYEQYPNRIRKIDANKNIVNVEKEIDIVIESLFEKWEI